MTHPLAPSNITTEPLTYQVRVEIPFQAPNEPRYWFQARVAPIAENNRLSQLVMTAQLIDSQGTHMYHGIASAWTDDKGKSWHPLPFKQVLIDVESTKNSLKCRWT